VFRICVLVSVPLTLLAFVAAPFLCTTIFGPDFAASVDDLRWLLPGTFGIIALRILGDALIAQRRPLRVSAATAVALAFTIALDVTLIPALGGEGAAIASTIAYSVGGLGIALVFLRTLRVAPVELLWHPGDLSQLKGQMRARLRHA